MNIVCIGDSLTKGYGVNPSKCWVSMLKDSLNMPMVNKGVIGDTSSGILSRFSRDVKKEETSKVIIMCGTNDALLNRNMKNVFKNINLMLSEATENGITPVILFPPKIVKDLAFERWDKKVDYDKSEELLNTLKSLLLDLSREKDIQFIDLSELMPAEPQYYSDGIHFNDLGNEFVFNILKDKLA
ncbi:GDSL-type esterase/lipase family protein [Clostridium massiliamazoniense]|uniref:GDSL-type esterase/lipase family protein n=1 Tax=Clostridium massiliamazoniense TaxID=1347366 RepID=UPI0006D7902A|nr:GDSL-type esterase/lipase family protein [Clostridium massiliamazoniense]